MFTMRQNENGFALFVTFLLMMCLSVAITMSLNSAKTDTDLSFNQLASEQAFYVAEAGIHRAEIELDRNSNWTSGFANVAFSGGTYAVTVITDSIQPGLGDTVILRATATMKEASGAIEEWLVPEVTYPYTYALFAKDRIDMMNNATTDSYSSDSGTYAATKLPIEGDIGSNGIIVLQENVKINGNVSTSLAGGITINKAIVTGDTTSKSAPAEVPSIPQSAFDQARASNSAPAGLTGSGYTFNSTTKNLTMGNNATLQLASGTYYFNDFRADNNATITVAPGAKVIIYVQKQMSLRNNSRFNNNGAPGNVTVFGANGCPPGTRELIIENNGSFWGSYYGPDNEVWVSNNGIAYGSLIGSKIMMDNNESFHYDRNLSKKSGPVSEDLEKIAWREL